MSRREIREIREGKWFKEQVETRDISICPHAFDKIYQAQRGIYTEESLKIPLMREVPHFVGLQENGRFTVYYAQKGFYLNIVVEIKERTIEVVSFMKKDTLPLWRT